MTTTIEDCGLSAGDLLLIAEAAANYRRVRDNVRARLERAYADAAADGTPFDAADMRPREQLIARYLEQFARACELELDVDRAEPGAFEADEWSSLVRGELADEDYANVRDAARSVLVALGELVTTKDRN